MDRTYSLKDDYTVLTRRPLQDVIDFIVGECKELAGDEGLPVSYEENLDYGRITKGAALALRSRVLLYAASDLYNNSAWTEGYEHPELISLTGDRRTKWAEIEGEMGDSHVGLQARLMSQALRKLTGVVSKSNCIVIFINQLREKVGVMFGNPETTTGGRALKFYASVRMDVRRIEALKQGGEVVGNRTRIKVVKNKIAPPFKEAEFDIMFGRGISREGDILDLGVNLGIVQKSGAWFAYNDSKIGQGRENAKNFLAENPQVMEEIEQKVREHYGLAEASESADVPETMAPGEEE